MNVNAIKLQTIIISLSDDSQENNSFENKVKMFKKIATYLRKLEVLLSIPEGQDQMLVMGNVLAVISKEFLNLRPNKYVEFSIKDVFLKYKLELSKITDVNIDINSTVLKLLSNCLLYIINLFQDENADVAEIFKHFLSLKKCLCTFSVSPVILDTYAFKTVVSGWIADLVKIITGADDIPRVCPKYLKVFNVIKQMLTSLATCKIYSKVILGEIAKKFECVLTYCAVNVEFISAYIASKTLIFEYLLWIMKTIIGDSESRGHSLMEVTRRLKIRPTLELLSKLLENKIPSAIKNLIDDILRVL